MLWAVKFRSICVYGLQYQNQYPYARVQKKLKIYLDN